MSAVGGKAAAGAAAALVLATGTAAAALASPPGTATTPGFDPRAHAAGVVPGDPPRTCADDRWFSDQIGTNRADRLEAPERRAQRLWGLDGADRLVGSPMRATCLFGGRGGDHLDLAAGGGLAWGEGGGDTILGSALGDRIDGGSGRDAIAAGDGADDVVSRDGNAEVVDCGWAQDRATADRADVLVGCERADTEGASTPLLPTRPRTAGASATVRIAFRAPRAGGAGAYRVLVTTGARGADCVDGPVVLARAPAPGERVRRGERVRIAVEPTAQGWCAGTTRAAVVLHRRCALKRCIEPPPGEPVARLRFTSPG